MFTHTHTHTHTHTPFNHSIGLLKEYLVLVAFKFYYTVGFPGGSVFKESARNAGDPGSIPGSRRSPAGGHGNPLQYPCLENPHGQRSLAGYSPLGRKKSNTSEQLAQRNTYNGAYVSFSASHY